jgi:hypothetical protein
VSKRKGLGDEIGRTKYPNLLITSTKQCIWLLPDRTGADIVGGGGDPILPKHDKNNDRKLFNKIPIIIQIGTGRLGNEALKTIQTKHPPKINKIK